MAAKQPETQSPEQKKIEDPNSLAMISTHVLGILGRPKDLYGVQVRALWGKFYRVNVLVGPDPASLKVAHSYFVSVDPSGNVLTSNPTIGSQY